MSLGVTAAPFGLGRLVFCCSCCFSGPERSFLLPARSFAQAAHEDDAVKVHDAVAALEQLRYSAEEPGMLGRQSREVVDRPDEEDGSRQDARPAQG